MLTASIILFTIAAMFGIVNAVAVLQKRRPPRIAVFSHGIFAAVALTLLIVYALMDSAGGLVTAAIVIFVLAASGGSYLFSRDITGKPIPAPIVAIHALAAITAFVILLVFALSSQS